MPGGFHPPPEVMLLWPTPNYEDPETRGRQVLVINVIFPCICLVVVCLRLYARIWIKGQPGFDDVLVTLAMIPTIGISALLILPETKFRWYRHIWDVPLSSITGRQLHSWVVQLLFVFSTALGKASILVLYRRVISRVAKRSFIAVVNAMIGALLLYTIAYFFLMLFQCRPTQSYWLQFSFPEPYTEEFSCFREGTVQLSNAISSLVTDFITATLPMFLFWQLRLPFREKLAMSVLFGIGFVVCIIGIVRTILVHRICYETYDITWVSHDIWLWLQIENSMTLICASIPPLNFLIKHIRGIPDGEPYFRRPSRNTHDSTARLKPDIDIYSQTRTLSLSRRPWASIEPVELERRQTPRRRDSPTVSELHDGFSKQVRLPRWRLAQELPPLPECEQIDLKEDVEAGTRTC